MSDVLDYLCRLFQPPEPPAPPPRQPAGVVTPILRSQLPDVTDPDYLGHLVISSDVTEADIERTVHSALMAQSVQDDIIEDGGRLIGLRVSTEPRPTGVPPKGPIHV